MAAESAARLPCPRCGAPADGPYYGPCRTCRDELRARSAQDGRIVEVGAYEPKRHVTPNAVAFRHD